MAPLIRLPRLRVKPPTPIHINLNAITSDGLIRVRGTRFPKPPRVGMRVVVVEPEDDIEGFAIVARMNESSGLVYLDVLWETLHDRESIQMIALEAPEAAAPAPKRVDMRLVTTW